VPLQCARCGHKPRRIYRIDDRILTRPQYALGTVRFPVNNEVGRLSWRPLSFAVGAGAACRYRNSGFVLSRLACLALSGLILILTRRKFAAVRTP
jgi:hypothetical protein